MRKTMRGFAVGFLICVLFLATAHDTAYAGAWGISTHTQPTDSQEGFISGPNPRREQQRRRQERVDTMFRVVGTTCIIVVGAYLGRSYLRSKKRKGQG